LISTDDNPSLNVPIEVGRGARGWRREEPFVIVRAGNSHGMSTYRYKPDAHGDFNIPGIVQLVFKRRVAKLKRLEWSREVDARREQLRATAARNEPLAETLKQEEGLPSRVGWIAIEPSDEFEGKVRLKIDTSFHLEPQAARRLIAALRDAKGDPR
jgi:hypothetical protein